MEVTYFPDSNTLSLDGNHERYYSVALNEIFVGISSNKRGTENSSRRCCTQPSRAVSYYSSTCTIDHSHCRKSILVPLSVVWHRHPVGIVMLVECDDDSTEACLKWNQKKIYRLDVCSTLVNLQESPLYRSLFY